MLLSAGSSPTQVISACVSEGTAGTEQCLDYAELLVTDCLDLVSSSIPGFQEA